jgi:eukaryotic-like serine/threonine-protein kinase
MKALHDHMITAFAGQSLGGYVLEEEIGRGSIGIVYRGKQLALGRDVAIKVFPRHDAYDPSACTCFLREAQIIARLNHPHIVRTYDAGQQDGVLYFVMEYVQGPTISSLLDLDGRLPPYLAAEYVAQAADALDAAYNQCHVIHRDLTPKNLMLDRWGRLKVMGFGRARVPDMLRLTTGHTLFRSLSYASPEHIWGAPLDHRNDIYALGVLLYEMVTGHRPFVGQTLQALVQVIITGHALPPTLLAPDLSPELEHILLTAMAPNREQRFAEASVMAKALRALHFHASSTGTGGSPWEKRTRAAYELSGSTTSPLPRHLTLPSREPRPPDVLVRYRELAV